ncbi:MAG: CpsD/CapB family tyrosine-protein kinase [Candidatus Eisenbacteria bacterium]
MTRIFDALKKAEAAREAAGAAVGPLAPVHGTPAPAARAPLARPVGEGGPLPLLGAVEMNDETLREMAALRVSLESALRDRNPRVLMFLSPQGGEGTSTVALQFAQALARDPGVRPVLVDVNVRRPTYDQDAAVRGAVISPSVAPRGAEPPAVSANLFVVPCPEDVRRTGLYQPAMLRQVLDAAVTGFDWVILDGPPVLEAPDASALGALADGVVLVVQAGRTKRPVLTRAADLLRKAGARVMGSVLNRRVLEIPEFIYRRI